jgi:arylsulfatase A-like enzyme
VRSWIARLGAFALALGAVGCAETVERDRVLILVVDGLRPDYVTEELMPRLNALGREGFRGLAHHAVFPTVTRVNGPSIFTGRLPNGHGLLGNSVYLPDVDASRTLNASVAADLRLIDQATNGVLLTAPSLGELLTERGLTYFAAASGSSGSGLLMNHTGAGAGLVHYEFSLPDSLAPIVSEVLGPIPEIPEGSNAVPLAAWAIDVLLRIGIDRADADVLSLWLTEPDGTGHSEGIGSPAMLETLRQLDGEIGRLLDGLADRGLLERTNILVTSDHGFSTHNGEISVNRLLVDAGLKESAQSTDVAVAGDAIHVREGGQGRVDAIVRLLQETDWIGPVFTRGVGPDAVLGSHAGTVSFQAIGWDHPRSADILTSAGWSDAENEYGWRGEVLTTGTAGHGSSSPWDVRATFIAAGPAIKRNVVSPVATGNIDIVPTTLALLGQPVPAGLDGRVLSEVLVTGPQPGEVSFAEDPVSTSVELGDRVYEFTLHRTRVGSTIYFDGTDVTRSPR